MQQLETSVHRSAKDEMSGILIRQGTRCLTEDELRANAQGREFVSIMNIDMYETRMRNNLSL